MQHATILRQYNHQSSVRSPQSPSPQVPKSSVFSPQSTSLQVPESFSLPVVPVIPVVPVVPKQPNSSPKQL